MHKKIVFFYLILTFCAVNAQETLQVSVAEKLIIQQQSIHLEISRPANNQDEIPLLLINGNPVNYVADDAKIIVEYVADKKETIDIQLVGHASGQIDISPMPLFWSIFPPLLAILLAILLKDAFVAIFLGVLFGICMINYYQGGWVDILFSPLELFNDYILNTISEPGHLIVIIFSLLAGGLTALISKNAGIKGLINRIIHWAKNRVSTQLTTYALGVAIFFDEYTNTLVVGNAMRALTDKAKVSREKLAYIVDSTASPVASIGLVTTWIGVELSYINSAIGTINQDSEYKITDNAYNIFLQSLPYSFYSVLTIIFVLMLILSQKDYGPMWKKEKEATQGLLQQDSQQKKSEDEVYVPNAKTPARALNALLPLLVLILGVPIGLIYTGEQITGVLFDEAIPFYQRLSTIIGAADGYVAILSSSFMAILTAVILTLSQGLLSLTDTVQTVTNGMKFMFGSVLILVMAWTLSDITKIMHTADFLSLLIESNIPNYLMPASAFLLAIAVAFSTGTSWGTMGVLYPIVIPIVWKVAHNSGLSTEEAYPLLFNSIGAILTGAVFGDHCSPISDTTILSSLASSCDHISHVKTQIPYALTVGSVSLLCCTIPVALGMPIALSIVLAVSVLAIIVHTLGKKTN